MQKTLLIVLAWLTLLSGTSAVLNVSGQERAVYTSADELQRDVTSLLLDKNINDVTRQLDSEVAATVPSLLRRLVIYSRAGQQSRIDKTLKQLHASANWECPSTYDLRWLIRNAAGNSLDARRFYYEQLCPNEIDGAGEFVRQWAGTGDQKELDAWLSKRSERNDEWLMLRVGLRAKAGTAGQVLDELAAELRASPADWERLDRYLKANNYAANLQDVSWLADIFEAHSAGDCFQLGDRLSRNSPEAGIRLLRKSLEIPFSDTDAKLVDHLVNDFRSVALTIKINQEKQLRYWTKRSLAETYQRLNQSLAAQPLIEELVAIKDDEILREDVHQLAGAVQAGSGQRVVETKILRDEATQRETARYWLDRAGYYDGRQEYGIERDSYRQALTALVSKPEDSRQRQERFEVVRSFAFFLAERHDDSEDKSELAKLLTTELRSVSPETDYAFQIARLISRGEFELETLQDSLLAKRPEYFARLLDSRREWGNEEKYLIQDVVNRDEVSSETKQKIWTSLEVLVRDPGSSRAYHLADAMQDCGEWQRAIPLWRGYLEHASKGNREGDYSDAVRNLFTAYCRTKQWRPAERLLLLQKDLCWRDLPRMLGEVALVAARENTIDDAMRLWRMSANLDRRNLEGLRELAQTIARGQLVAMYSRMKVEDPLSNIPDLALQLMQ